MIVGLSQARLAERVAALREWQREGGSTELLADLDRRVRHGQRSDFPGRAPGPEVRTAAPWPNGEE